MELKLTTRRGSKGFGCAPQSLVPDQHYVIYGRASILLALWFLTAKIFKYVSAACKPSIFIMLSGLKGFRESLSALLE